MKNNLPSTTDYPAVTDSKGYSLACHYLPDSKVRTTVQCIIMKTSFISNFVSAC